MKINSNSAVAHYGLGFCQTEKGQWREGLESLDKSLAIFPDNPLARERRGMARFMLGEFEGATDDFTIAISSRPNLAFSYVGRAEIYLVKNNFANAAADIKQALAINPSIPKAYVLRGFLHERENDQAAAEQDYNKAIGLQANFGEAYYRRGLLYKRSNRDDRAREDFTKAYAQGIRFACLINSMKGLGMNPETITRESEPLRTLKEEEC